MTLYHLYTIAGLVLALALIYRLFRCKHAWELVDKTEFKSAYELLHQGASYWRDQLENLLKRKVVIVMRCNKCGSARIHEFDSR